MNPGVRYGSFSVRTECSHCGQPLPLHGPSRAATCSYCLNEVALPPALWRHVLEAFDERHERLAVGEQSVATLQTDGFRVSFEIGREAPACEKCRHPFAVDSIGIGSEQNFACPSCGDPASTSPAPSWLRDLVPTARQFYSTEPSAGKTATSAVALAQPRAAIKPVVMSCPQCSGSLEVTEHSERILTCRYCNSDVYLPDEVWRRLHPVKTVQKWFLRFEGKSRGELEREREAEAERREHARQQEIARVKREARERAQRERDREIAELKARAWGPTLWFAGALIGLIVWNFAIYASPGLQSGSTALVGNTVLVMVSLALLIVATIRASRPIQQRTGHDRDWMIFCTWFWLPFVMLFPLIGSVIGLVRAILLFRGKFGASTITTNNTSTRHYGATQLPHGEGRPAAVLFLILALLWPLAAITLGFG